MTFLRTLSTALGRMADRMQGQDVERHNAVVGNRMGGDVAAVTQARTSQGVSLLGLGR